MSSFASLGRAQEGYFFNSEERLAVVRRLERLVESVSYKEAPLILQSNEAQSLQKK